MMKEDREGGKLIIFILSNFYGNTTYLLKVKNFYGSVILIQRQDLYEHHADPETKY